MSYILDYTDKINSNKLIVGDLIKREYEQLANNAIKPNEFHLDINESNRHIDFIEKFCKQSQGKMGEPLRLELFQKAMLEAMFGFLDDNDLRQYREVLDVVGRKNGKTTLLAAVSLDMLCNDKEGAPEIYFIATKLDQAKKGFDEAERMRKQSPFLCKHIRKRGYDIYFEMNEGVIKPIASDSKKLDGFNSSCVIIDELGAITNRRIYDDMKQSFSSRRQPMLVCITTNNFVRDGIFDDQLKYAKSVINGTIKDDRFLPIIYTLDKKEEWLDPKMWPKANPGLGKIKLKTNLQDYVNKAKNDKAFRPTVLVKDFNEYENANTGWLTYDEANNTKVVDMEYLKHSYAIGGCDLSSTTDLTCATVILQKPNDDNIYVLQKYFLPQPRIDEVEQQEVKEAPYKIWSEKGLLKSCQGATVDYHDVTEWFLSLVNDYDIRPLWIGYDAALSGYWREEMEEKGFDLEKIRQGAFTWTYPLKQLTGLFKEHKVLYQANPMLLWCLMNTGIKSANKDGIESQMPVKIQSNRRIDGTVSLLNAFTCLKNHEEEYGLYIR